MQVKGMAELEKFMAELPKKIEAAIVASIDEMGQKTAGSIVQAATFENFTGETRGMTRYVKDASGKGGAVMMPRHGIFVDRAPAHWVSMTASRPQLLAWAMQAQSKEIQKGAAAIARGDRKQMSLHVYPHPFIDKGFNRALSTYETIIRANLERAFV